MTNAEIAKLLRQVAAVFEVRDQDFFRTRAYQNAANAIENLTISAHDLWEQGKLTEIPGVGPNLAQHLGELFKTGKVRHFDHELKKVPAGMFALLTVRGIGPKTAFKIAKQFQLKDEKTALAHVKKLIDSGKIRSLPGMGQKSEAKIKTSIEAKFSTKASTRMLLSEVLPIAEDYINYIKTVPGVVNVEPLGSTRRRLATVGDIDLAISTDQPAEVTSKVLKYPQISKVISSGENLSRVKLKSGHEVDIKLCSPSEWGSLLQHYTGSKLHNIALRSYALEKHFSLSEHGIKNLKTGKIFRAKDEKEFYAHLGLPYLPPELREGEEELALAKRDQIPRLVELDDIKGDLHIHSDFEFETSHDIGSSTLGQILDQARRLKYDYIGLSDHNPKYQGLSSSQKKNIIERRNKALTLEYAKYEKRVKTRVPKLLTGLEVDIRKEGDLALDDSLLDLLDYAIVSVHSGFDLSKAENTIRILAALNHPKALILGHPTGRLINRRDSIEADWEEIIKFCGLNHKILEVNAEPDRLDLPDDLIKMAVRQGVKVAIDTDSHEIGQLVNMKYGVWTARRGWCQKRDVINTGSYSDLRQVLQLKG